MFFCKKCEPQRQGLRLDLTFFIVQYVETRPTSGLAYLAYLLLLCRFGDGLVVEIIDHHRQFTMLGAERNRRLGGWSWTECPWL